LIVNNGRANDLVKYQAKRKRLKEEITAEKKSMSTEKMHMEKVKEVEEALQLRSMSIDKIPALIEDHTNLIGYLKNKGLMDSTGKMK
jgi:hypothetical protein